MFIRIHQVMVQVGGEPASVHQDKGEAGAPRGGALPPHLQVLQRHCRQLRHCAEVGEDLGKGRMEAGGGAPAPAGSQGGQCAGV